MWGPEPVFAGSSRGGFNRGGPAFVLGGESVPWTTEQRDGKWVVLKKGTNEVVGTHDDEAGANAQVKALYAKEGKMSAMHLVDAFETVNEGQPIRLIPV